MIVLDAAFLIAYLEGQDAHHAKATELMVVHADQSLRISPVNRAEVLVGPARYGSIADATRVLEVLGLEDVPLDDTAPVRLAEIRAATSLKLPDCCALLAAESTGATLATFDERLRRAAGERGIATLP